MGEEKRREREKKEGVGELSCSNKHIFVSLSTDLQGQVSRQVDNRDRGREERIERGGEK